jgi:hypothetical protein
MLQKHQEKIMSAVERYSELITMFSQFYHQVTNTEISQPLKDSIVSQTRLGVELGATAEKSSLTAQAALSNLKNFMDLAETQTAPLVNAVLLISASALLLIAGPYYRANNAETESTKRKYSCIALQIMGLACLAFAVRNVYTFVGSNTKLYNLALISLSYIAHTTNEIDRLKAAFPITSS